MLWRGLCTLLCKTAGYLSAALSDRINRLSLSMTNSKELIPRAMELIYRVRQANVNGGKDAQLFAGEERRIFLIKLCDGPVTRNNISENKN